MRRIGLLILAAVCSMTLWAEAYSPETVPAPWLHGQSRFVANPDGILLPNEVSAVAHVAEQIYAISNVEVATVVLREIDRDAFDFSVALFNSWGIGDKAQNRGVLVLFALESRDIRITTGGGVEGLLPDARCQQILDDYMIPLLREGKYAEGLLEGNKALGRLLTTDEARAELLLGYRAKEVSEEPWSIFAVLCIIFMICLLVYYSSLPRCPKCKKKEVRTKKQTLRPATFAAAGLGLSIYSCKCCGHRWEKEFTIPRKQQAASGPVIIGGGGRRGGGGFSGGGFGGGMTFGGGAGGKF